MLKIRFMGTKSDISWFRKILQKSPEIEIREFSNFYPNKGTKKYYRTYAEIGKNEVKEEQ